jgi:hypothetical protein
MPVVFRVSCFIIVWLNTSTSSVELLYYKFESVSELQTWLRNFSLFSPVSLTPLINIHSRIPPQIFEKIRNSLNGILRGLGDLKSEISCPLISSFHSLNTMPQLMRIPFVSSVRFHKLRNVEC